LSYTFLISQFEYIYIYNNAKSDTTVLHSCHVNLITAVYGIVLAQQEMFIWKTFIWVDSCTNLVLFDIGLTDLPPMIYDLKEIHIIW